MKLNIKKTLSLITTWFTALAIGNTCFINADSNSCINIEPDQKLSQELKEQMAQVDDTELIPVGIILKDLNASEIDKLIEQKSDFRVSDYKDIDTYNECILPGIIKESEKKYGTEAAHLTLLKDPISNEITYAADIYYDEKTPSSKFLSDMKYAERVDYIASKVSDNFKSKLIKENTGMSMITKAVSDNIDEYMSVRRKCVLESYKKYNYDFIKNYISNENIAVNSGFAPFLIVMANKKQIDKIANDMQVETLSFSPNREIEPALWNSTNVVNALETQNTNLGYGYTGLGVKIGILEALHDKYDSTYCMLNNCQNLNYFYYEPSDHGTVTGHATMVTSIIKGKPTTYNGHTYVGVAPDSTVYQTYIADSYSMCDCIAAFAIYGVSIINLSGGYYLSSYNEIDWLADCAVNNLGIVFVTSSGNNNEDVMSPGKGYNVITVGNCNACGTTPYPIHVGIDGSSYIEPNYITNKPDICAPGTNVIFPNLGSWTGTSISAPIVSGIAAQMIQCMPSLKVPTASPSDYEGRTYYSTVKALILLGANYQIISTTDNDTKMSGSNSNLFRDKSGAGMIDAKKTIDIILGNGYYRTITNIKMASNGTSPNGMSIFSTFGQGESLRSVLCFSRIHQNYNNIIEIYNGNDIDLDLTLRDTTNTILVYSNSAINNVELIEYQFIANGNYLLSADLYGTNTVGVGETLPGALVYYSVEP